MTSALFCIRARLLSRRNDRRIALYQGLALATPQPARPFFEK
jgi:hypothetical protein